MDAPSLDSIDASVSVEYVHENGPADHFDAEAAEGKEGLELESELRSNDTASQTLSQSRELVFVDTAAPDYQQLLDDLLANGDAGRTFEVLLLDPDRDGVEQISETLAGYDDLEAVHIVSHGSAGNVGLGNTWLRLDNLDAYAGQIASWQHSMSGDADLLFYGCSLAQSQDGQTLIDALSALTGADVAASDDMTGHTDLGGDWVLEYLAGNVETDVAFSTDLQQNWFGTLAGTLVSHWDFEEGSGQVAADSVGSNDGELGSTAGADGNDPAWTNDAERGNVLSFDGNSDYVNLSGTSPAGNFSVAGWGSADSAASNGWHAMYSTAGAEIWLGISTTGGQFVRP